MGGQTIYTKEELLKLGFEFEGDKVIKKPSALVIKVSLVPEEEYETASKIRAGQIEKGTPGGFPHFL